MEVLLITFLAIAIIAIPCGLAARAWIRAEKDPTTPSPETMAKRTRRYFYMFFWGFDMAIGAIPLKICLSLASPVDADILKTAMLPILFAIIGIFLVGVGLIGVKVQSRRLEFVKNRERAPIEEWFYKQVSGLEGRNEENLMASVSVATNNKVDDLLTVVASEGALSRFFAIGKVYTGRNVVKNHWPWMIVAIISILAFTIT